MDQSNAGGIYQDDPQELQRIKNDFAQFLDPGEDADGDNETYAQKIEDMVKNGEKRLIIDLSHLRNRNQQLAQKLLDKPRIALPQFEHALEQHIRTNQVQGPKKKMVQTEWKVGFEGAFGNSQVSPRELLAGYLGKLICVEGIVTKASLVRPKVVKTVHFCPETKKFQSAEYRDATSLDPRGPTGSSYPRADRDGNRLETEYGLCTYQDHQTVFIQDMPERTQAGTMPRSVECILDGDMVDACKPGDRVQMIGLYRSLSGKVSGEISGKFRPVVIVNNIRKIGVDDSCVKVSRDDLTNIKEVAKRKDVFDLLARSVAPSIYGHEYIKKGITLQLLGGVEKNLENGAHIRGDINILMVGDPSCAKSQLLRVVMKTAPLAINTTGRGSSAAGLTAAVLQDKDSGERRLEAGAMVLADRGVVCIDEFDKMTDQDRTAIHEVMEQQTVTVAKAGIHCTLNARCSVIAASNPVYGQYDRDKKPHENIALPDSLLSRFDLLFIVLDKLDAKLDRAISAHVLDMHRFRKSADADAFDEDDMMEEENLATQIYEKKEKLMRGAAGAMRAQEGTLEDYLTVDFCKKFIHFAKQTRKPKLTNAAAEMIARQYADLRDTTSTQSMPITARCLETLIRLSAAHAKCRLSTKISKRDVTEAAKVLGFALTNDVEGAAITSYGDEDEGMEVDGAMEDGEDEKTAEVAEPQKRKVRSRRRRNAPDTMEVEAPQKKALRKSAGEGSGDRAPELTTILNKHFRTSRADSIKVEQLCKLLGAGWDRAEVDRIVDGLHKSNKVFVHQGEIHQL